MKKYILLLSAVFLVILFAYSTSAANSFCSVTIAEKTQDFINQIPAIDSAFQTCPIYIQGSVNSLVGNGEILVDVVMTSGNVQSFYLTIQNKQITHITPGTTTNAKFVITTDEATFDKILSSNDISNEILKSYNNKKIKIVAKGFFNKMKFFFAKFFIPSSPNSGSQGEGKPKDCDDTYLPGHRNYAENKDLWDSYSADTDGVCQSIYGKGQPSPCVHGVQLSIEGNPYYLCWYRNK